MPNLVLPLDLPLDPALPLDLALSLGSVLVLVLVLLCVWPSLAVYQGAVRVGASPLCSSSPIEPSQEDGQTRAAALVWYLGLNL